MSLGTGVWLVGCGVASRLTGARVQSSGCSSWCAATGGSVVLRGELRAAQLDRQRGHLCGGRQPRPPHLRCGACCVKRRANRDVACLPGGHARSHKAARKFNPATNAEVLDKVGLLLSALRRASLQTRSSFQRRSSCRPFCA